MAGTDASLRAVQNIRNGQQKDYLPDEYRKNYHEMDKVIVEKHQGTTLEESKHMLEGTHREMMQLAESFTDKELLPKATSNALTQLICHPIL